MERVEGTKGEVGEEVEAAGAVEVVEGGAIEKGVAEVEEVEERVMVNEDL